MTKHTYEDTRDMVLDTLKALLNDDDGHIRLQAAQLLWSIALSDAILLGADVSDD